jgi:hypothetical protein
MRRKIPKKEWVFIPPSTTTTTPPQLQPFVSPVSTQPSPAHAINVRNVPRTDSHKASMMFGGEENESLIASSRLLSPFLEYEIGSPFDFDVDATPQPNTLDSGVQPPQGERIKPKPQPRVQFAGVVAQTHTSPVIPEGEWKRKRRDSPVCVVDLGWDHVQHTENENKKEQKSLPTKLFSDIDGTQAPPSVRPQLPPRPVMPHSQPFPRSQPKSFPSHDGKAKYPPPLDAKTLQTLKAPPAVVHKYEVGKEKDTLSHLLDRTREIYHAGPEGEGQKVWSGIKRLREEKKKKKKKETTRKQEQYPYTGFEELTNKGTATVLPRSPPAAHIKHQPQVLQGKRYPRLPSESERLYPISPITERASFNTARAAKSNFQGESKARGKEPVRQFEATVSSIFRSIDLPLKASDSVQYDATYVELDMSAPGKGSVYLQPAPRSRKGAGNGRASSKEASRSPPRMPEKALPPVPQEKDLRNDETKVSALRAPALADRYATLSDVQHQEPDFQLGAGGNQSTECISLGPSLSKEKEHKVDWLHKVGRLKVPTMPLDWTHTDKDLTKRHDRLKAKIGQPQPLIVRGEIVNVAEDSGGVGGPSAARWMPPVHPGQAVTVDLDNKGRGKHREAPPRPKLPTEAQKPSKSWMERRMQSHNEPTEETSKFFQSHTRSRSKLWGLTVA